MTYADYVIVGAVLVVALAALSIETQVRAIRDVLERLARREDFRAQPHSTEGPSPSRYFPERRGPKPGRPPVHSSGIDPESPDERMTGFSVWSWKSGVWSPELDCCREGFSRGAPPHREGRFEGECVRTLCKKSRP